MPNTTSNWTRLSDWQTRPSLQHDRTSRAGSTDMPRVMHIARVRLTAATWGRSDVSGLPENLTKRAVSLDCRFGCAGACHHRPDQIDRTMRLLQG